MTEWSGWDGPVTNRFRVGVDLSRSGGTVTATYRAECTQAINQEITLNRSGALTGGVNFRMNHGSSGGTTVVGSYTRSISAGQTLTFGASLSGVYNGASPSVSGVSISRPSDAPVPPSAPGRPTVDALTATSVTVTFGPPSSDGGSPIINHQFQFATDSGYNNQVAAPQFTGGRTYTQGGLSPAVTYWVRARVQNSAGWGSWSASQSFATPPLPPLPPSGVSASRQSDSVAQVSWSASSSSSRPVTYQQVQRAVQDMSGWSSYVARGGNLSGSARAYQDSIGENRRYRYRVRTGNGQGSSAWAYSDIIATTPAAPVNVSARRTAAGGIEVTWVNRANIPLGFEIVHDGGDGWEYGSSVEVMGAWQRSWVDASPDPALTHRYSVRTIGHDGLRSSFGIPSNTVQLEAPPDAPTGLSPDGGTHDGNDEVTLTWRHNAVDTSDQERFEVAYREVGSGSWTPVAPVDSGQSRYVLPAETLSNETDHEWRVRTWGAHATPSPWSTPATIRTSARPTVALNAPELDETIDTSSVEVVWGYGHEVHPQVAWRVTLHRDDVLVQEHSGGGESSSLVLSGLANDADYAVGVHAQSAAGLWSYVDTVTFHVDYAEPQAPNIDVSWDVESGAAVVELSQPPYDPDFPEAAYVQVWRAIDDGPWLLIADEVPLDTAVSDPIPAIGDGTINYYRATAVSALPSTADSAEVPLAVPSTGKGGAGGWVYLNAGPGMSQVCRVRANATRSDSEGVAKVLHHFAGRPAPVEYAGTARAREWDVSARIAPDYDGASTRDELVDMQALPAPVCYRDPLGARWFASMGPVASSWRSIMGEVSWSMTEVDVTEGLDVQQRDTDSEGTAA